MMDQNSPYLRIRTADPRLREKIYEEIYDRRDALNAEPVRPSTPRRRKRLAIYTEIIGTGHGAILELGCGTGDLTCALAALASHVVGIDMSSQSLEVARRRADTTLAPDKAAEVELLKMNAVAPEFAEQSFDYAVSTSMIEHLHPEDVDIHLREVWRVLKPGGRYLVWCPNRLGHHKDRPDHLSMLSYADLRSKMYEAGFREFCSPMFKMRPMVDTRFKIAMEQAFSRLRIGVLWSHLGIRNVLIVAAKPTAVPES